MRRRLLAVIGLGLGWAGCGSQDPPQVADAVVAVAIRSQVEVPFHGPLGPGTEPISIDLRWTVVITATGGAECQVRAVRTLLTERSSGTARTTEGGPLGYLPGWGTLELPQRVSGFFPSTHYPGEWTGVTTVEVLHASGRSETLSAAFTFR